MSPVLIRDLSSGEMTSCTRCRRRRVVALLKVKRLGVSASRSKFFGCSSPSNNDRSRSLTSLADSLASFTSSENWMLFFRCTDSTHVATSLSASLTVSWLTSASSPPWKAEFMARIWSCIQFSLLSSVAEVGGLTADPLLSLPELFALLLPALPLPFSGLDLRRLGVLVTHGADLGNPVGDSPLPSVTSDSTSTSSLTRVLLTTGRSLFLMVTVTEVRGVRAARGSPLSSDAVESVVDPASWLGSGFLLFVSVGNSTITLGDAPRSWPCVSAERGKAGVWYRAHRWTAPSPASPTPALVDAAPFLVDTSFSALGSVCPALPDAGAPLASTSSMLLASALLVPRLPLADVACSLGTWRWSWSWLGSCCPAL